MYSLCLGGGGAKGAYQVGVLKALKEFDISIAAISGSSIGALNGLFYLGCDIEKIEEGWLNLSKEDFLSIDDDNLLNGICGRQGLIDTINKYVDFDRFYNSKILLFASVVNGDQISYVLLNKLTKEQIIDYVLASSAMPIIYGEIKINGKAYVDGVVIDNIHIYPLINSDFQNIISVPLGDGLDTTGSIAICPSIDLGGLIKGTLNFDKEDIELRIKLGYLDALECLYNDFGKDIDILYVTKEKALLKSNFNLLETNKDINRNLDILKKYGF